MQESKQKAVSKIKKVLARLTITRKGSAKKMIVEVLDGASFCEFYQFYSQEGRKRKRFMRSANRNEGIHPYYQCAFVKPGLDVVAERIADFQKNIDSMNIKVFSKRKYNQLLTCAVDQLNGKLPANNQKIAHWSEAVRGGRGIAVRLPVDYLPLSKRLDILTGARS